MLLIPCPWCGPRDEIEFRYGGQAGLTYPEDPEALSDEEWADYVFNRSGEPGVKREWWYHLPSGTWFIAERDNRTDVFLRTYLLDDPPR